MYDNSVSLNIMTSSELFSELGTSALQFSLYVLHIPIFLNTIVAIILAVAPLLNLKSLRSHLQMEHSSITILHSNAIV